MKRQFKYCNSNFRKKKLKIINRIEYNENGVLIQVTTIEEVENTIMKENLVRFCLVYSLEDNIYKELGPSGEG